MAEQNSEIKKAGLKLIESSHIMNIATSAKGRPWSTPVYYLYHRRAFWFFSKPSSRHISEAIESKAAAASIHSESSGWEDIKGIQMSGEISDPGINPAAVRAFAAYIKRFRFIKEIKKSSFPIKDPASLERAFNVRFYKFTPKILLYQDNSIRFGFRQRIFDL